MKKIDNNIYEVDISDIRYLFPIRDIDCNKGDFGKAGIYGGSVEYSGALKLASLSLGALRSGTGISRIITSKNVLPLLGPNILEQTLVVLPDYEDSHFREKLYDSISDLDSLAFGMGLGNDSHLEEVLEFLIKKYTGNLIIDAEGLNTLSRMKLEILKDKKCNIVLTPHVKEFSRLCFRDIEEVKRDSLQLVLEFAKKYQVIVLLKGHTTTISDGVDTYLVTTGCPGMATAGSGDVLSGILAGMLAYHDFTMKTISASVFLHGIAGSLAEEESTDISMVASDIISYIGKAIKVIRCDKSK